ncbi:ArsR/SmtB family transcription factor [Caldisalinibacter kiritimatiensis]|uniref:Transcriptional regulator, ArsR family n=1 Tax=Caldisalinibacter kiritimatiensis TaxID=1304284 RepID=R1AT26_9FIRM|nr:metalloregulator ArsR/SmtB family transcription factor [Caldisalinibacter kiritimatiensis]EOD00293.1 Transcriptional regulator, ArsR family [Caldisalinibacter kiritimatiensis]
MNFEEMEVKILKALAHPIRLKIVKKLSEGTLCVCELNADVEFSQSNLSQHLRVLKDAGIVISERDGSKILYSIKNEKVLEVIKLIEDMILSDIEKMTKKIRR